MSDHDDLRNLLQRYARAADNRDVAALAGLFHPDAEIAGARGPLDLAAWLETMSGPRAFPTSMHLIGDPLIDVAEGSDEAHLDTYAVVYQLSEPGSGSADLTLGIRYHDRAVRWEGRWVVAHRTATTVWMR